MKFTWRPISFSWIPAASSASLSGATKNLWKLIRCSKQERKLWRKMWFFIVFLWDDDNDDDDLHSLLVWGQVQHMGDAWQNRCWDFKFIANVSNGEVNNAQLVRFPNWHVSGCLPGASGLGNLTTHNESESKGIVIKISPREARNGTDSAAALFPT